MKALIYATVAAGMLMTHGVADAAKKETIATMRYLSQCRTILQDAKRRSRTLQDSPVHKTFADVLKSAKGKGGGSASQKKGGNPAKDGKGDAAKTRSVYGLIQMLGTTYRDQARDLSQLSKRNVASQAVKFVESAAVDAKGQARRLDDLLPIKSTNREKRYADVLKNYRRQPKKLAGFHSDLMGEFLKLEKSLSKKLKFEEATPDLTLSKKESASLEKFLQEGPEEEKGKEGKTVPQEVPTDVADILNRQFEELRKARSVD